MNKLTSFEVLIVYAEGLAISSYDKTNKSETPFDILKKNNGYNEVYGYFLETCEKMNLKAAFTTSADIIGPGFCRSFWIYKNSKWVKVNSSCYSKLIFDKFSPKRKGTKARRELLFSNKEIKPFNNPDLYNLFFDKQKTFDNLSDYAIPTVTVGENTLENMNVACQKLVDLMQIHLGINDFSSDVIMKDKFGSGGNGIYKFRINDRARMVSVAKKHPLSTYIIQPFVKFDTGFLFKDNLESADIRLIFLGGKIVQSYIRVAKTGDFRCNEHQGGLLTYLNLNEIPIDVVNKANEVAEILNKKCSLFTLDFIVSNSGNVYLLEGNTGPGLDWNTSLPQNEIEAKKLINLIVGELLNRVSAI